MSLEAMVWALTKAPVADPVARLVLVGLANHAGPDGAGAWPKQATLAEYVGVSTRTVRTKLRLLEDVGVIRPGDQRTVAHISADRRPTVWDLQMTAEKRAEDVSGRATGGNLRPDGRKSTTPRAEDDDTTGGNTLPTEPSLNQSSEPVMEPGGETAAAPLSGEVVEVEPARDDVTAVCQIVSEHVYAVTGERVLWGKRWETQARLMLDRDGRTVDEVRALMAWVTASSFWSPNILSVPKLREKWPTLVGQARRDLAQQSGGTWLEQELARAATFAGGGAR